MRTIVSAIFGILACSVAEAQNPVAAAPPVEREVRGQTIISNRVPAAKLTFADDFRYVGAQVVTLYGNANAEQHLFVKGGSNGPVECFYWVQFEHFLPTNGYTYTYRPDRTTHIGGLQFIYDVKAFVDYGVTASDPRSDNAAVVALLARHHLALPARTARVRMFHLPTADRRTELMIIYGEALPATSTIPTAADGVPLDSAFADAAKTILAHARQGLTIRKL